MSEFRYEKDADRIATVTLELTGHPADVTDPGFIAVLREMVGRLESDDVSGAVLVVGAKDAADVATRPSPASLPGDRAQVFDQLTALNGALRRLEKLGKPVVAAITGSALGRSFQVCLAAQRRIVLKDASLALGLPEASLGLLPGAGGATRLVRQVGLAKALPLLMEGTRLTPEQALEQGLVDQLADNRDDLIVKAKAWIKSTPVAQQPWDQKSYKMPGGTMASPGVAQMVFMAPALLRKKSLQPQPAPEAVVAVAVEGSLVGMESALRIESRYALERLFAG